ncbi:MAG: TIGR01777 family oxidoreductase [bacterium]
MIAVSGATGLIGSALVQRLRAQGHTVRRLVRGRDDPQAGDIAWDPAHDRLDPAALEGCDAIVHLAGAPIAQRWTDAHKRDIRESRTQSTSLLARTVAAMATKPEVVLSGSAIGYYGSRGDEILDEHSVPGSDFLAGVVQAWESAAMPIADLGVRLVLLRTGIVLSAHGGALAKMLPPFRLGIAGPLGGGAQWMSWIALDDHVRAMEHALATNTVHGAVNLVTPNPVTNAEFTTTLGRVLHRPAIIPVPAFALELLYGEMADATILAGQRVRPHALSASAFQWTEPTLEGALRAALQ